MDSTVCYPLTPTTLLIYASIANRFPRRRNFSRAIAIGGGAHSLAACTAKPVYTPTPHHRLLRTPHSGYHYDGSPRQFFEGWYFKVSIPEIRQSFCFMYAVDNPAFRKPLSTLEIARFGTKTTGAAAQVLGPNDEYICQFSPDSTNFWGSKHELALGHTFTLTGDDVQPPKRELPPEEFNRRVLEGFQVTPLWHQGAIRDDGRNYFAKAVGSMRWEYSTRPTYGWGDANSDQKSTAGWLAAFPVFEPHWQICMASGLSTGWIEWDGKKYEFENAPSYSEKNWGCGFPRKWAWVQCNVFKGLEASLTSAVAIRQLPGPSDVYENVGMIGLHYDGKLYEFVPWYGELKWEITQWGFWRIEAENPTHAIELEATTEEAGCPLRAPTVESGFAPACKDTCFGVLRVKLWERKNDGSKGKVIMDAESEMAALEVGGGPWFCTWKSNASTPEILAAALRAPIHIDAFFNLFPIVKPPGF